MRKAISVMQNLHLIDKFYTNNTSKSFSDFEKLNLGGAQEMLSFGEYCQKNYNKNRSNRNSRRKVIYYFYRNLQKR